MSVIFVLIPLSILFASIFLFSFIWAVKSGQYEDTCTPSLRPLMDEATVTGSRPIAKNSSPQTESVHKFSNAKNKSNQT